MNTFASLIQQRKPNNLMAWLHKPALHQLGANLAPLQKFVKRTAKGSHFYFGAHHISDDQTVDTTSTWEDNDRIQGEQSSRIKQSVVVVSHGPPVTSITAKRGKVFVDRAAIELRQRKSQQKNKVLMLLQLEQVTAMRTAMRNQWQTLRKDIFLEVAKRRTSQLKIQRLRRIQDLDDRIRTQRRVILNKSLVPLQEFYRKFDACLDELHDRNEIIELEAFKQLVIREVEERAEAVHDSRERMKIVHGQLMQKFIVKELIEGGLYSQPTIIDENLHEWIQVGDQCRGPIHVVTDSSDDRSEWVVCDFF